MTTLQLALALFLLLLLAAGLWRLRRGPTAADRMLSAQLFGTTAAAILLLLAEALALPALRDVALVLALLAVIAVIAFIASVKSARPDQGDADQGEAGQGEADQGEAGQGDAHDR